ncbi:thiamine pyrophosphate-dependent enzyme, partial [Bacillus sp. SIMBA_005]|uniref:thiamine pyrophosphate-dependent enzyme n=1 Tax=Bacillus sp. SIMBA_005 TaxID=3085754 RepID=UPI00397C9C47
MVLNNEDLNQVTWEQRVMEGDPKFDASQKVPNVPYHRFAEMLGLTGIYVDEAGQLADAWETALAAKAGIVGLTRALALEGARHGVTANAIA